MAQVHESLASRAASPLERGEDCGELVARMLHYQQVCALFFLNTPTSLAKQNIVFFSSVFLLSKFIFVHN